MFAHAETPEINIGFSILFIASNSYYLRLFLNEQRALKLTRLALQGAHETTYIFLPSVEISNDPCTTFLYGL